MTDDDLYALLGVLPDAEDVVIKAAYRALAQRYHPDRWGGGAAEANRRMAELNAAWAVLGDPRQRAEYDQARSNTTQGIYPGGEEQAKADAFDSALAEVEGRWQVACSIYPDLAEYRNSLRRIATSLAFSYVVGILESKAYAQRADIANHLERTFLERYFGSDARILEYARYLIVRAQKPAAKALNRLVDVMGSGVDADLLIAKIDTEFGIEAIRASEAAARKLAADAAYRLERIEALKRRGRSASIDTWHFDEAWELATLLGYEPEEEGGFFKSRISVKLHDSTQATFISRREFQYWLVRSIRAEGAARG